MGKIRTLIKAPLLTQSGYGVHSRQIFRALFSDPMFELFAEDFLGQLDDFHPLRELI